MAKAKKAKDVRTGPGRSEKPITTEVSEASRDHTLRSRINAKEM
jgi:hypothetical protein